MKTISSLTAKILMVTALAIVAASAAQAGTLASLINKALERNISLKISDLEIEQSYENMRIVFTRYQEGASSIIELIDAQRLLTNSSQTAIKAYYDERERLAEILLLLHKFDELYLADQNPSILNTDFLMQALKLGESKK